MQWSKIMLRIVRGILSLQRYFAYGKKACLILLSLRLDEEVIVEKQKHLFKNLNLDYEKGIKKLSDVLNANKHLGGIMQSDHYIAFAALAVSNFTVKRILEIGTYDAKTAALLSLLFPAAQIDTIDLSDGDRQFIGSYGRDDFSTRSEFVDSRNQIISKFNNINAFQLNSLSLIWSDRSGKGYDLIWIDGNHDYPFVPIDIANAFRLVSDDGIVMCDDVHSASETFKKGFNQKPSATIETLMELKNAELIKFNLIYKRIGRIFHVPKAKYIALCHLTTDSREVTLLKGPHLPD